VKWIFDKITEYLLVDQNVEITKPFEVIHLHKYLSGNEFERHSDIYYPNQTLNVGVCLNDDYEGGDFILYGPKEIIPKKAGTIYSFRNTREHEVTKIESGIRYSLIIFLYKENIKSIISLI
jgi:predicted 2-oxoglutarate/Fe(II)-dependent dioxygenase YbiX